MSLLLNSGLGYGGTISAGSIPEFYESFESVATSPWYDGGADSHAVGSNPNGGNAYVHPYEIGDSEQEIGGVSAASTQTLRRKLSAPSDVIDIIFLGWADAGFVPHDGDHLFYVRLNTSGDFSAPTSGFTAYLEATSGGKMHFNNRRTDNTFENQITATLGNDFHAGVPRDIRWFMQMNDLGSSNGILRVWVDDTLVIEDTARTYRQNSGEQFQQILIAPYAGAVQTANAGVYVDELYVYTTEQA